MEIFWGLLKFKVFLAMPDIHDILRVNSRLCVQAYVLRKNENIPLWAL